MGFLRVFRHLALLPLITFIFLSSQSFVVAGDGKWHNLTGYTGWEYLLTTDNQLMVYKHQGYFRFYYNYGSGLWHAFSNDTNKWADLGKPNTSSHFIGDSSQWHDIGGNQSYLYRGHEGYWKDNGYFRFSYTYTVGQWSDWSTTTNEWSLLGNRGRLGAYPGDAWLDLGDGKSYLYSGHRGYWKLDNQFRFYYNYLAGSWYTLDGTQWKALAVGLDSVNSRLSTGRDLLVADYVMYYVNDIRRSQGLSAWTYNADVGSIARHHTNDIIALNQFDHTLNGAASGWRSVEDRFRQIGWTGWASQVGENLYVTYSSRMGDYELGFTDSTLRSHAKNLVYEWVYDDAASNWGHRYPIMNENGWHLNYAAAYYRGGVVTLNFSELNL